MASATPKMSFPPPLTPPLSALTLPVVTLPKGSFVYKRSFAEPKTQRQHPPLFSWFSLEPGYGSEESYGPIVTTWALKKEVRLLNLSTMEKRRRIIAELILLRRRRQRQAQRQEQRRQRRRQSDSKERKRQQDGRQTLRRRDEEIAYRKRVTLAMHPDEQYSGGKGNLVAHLCLKNLLNAHKLDGTYINEDEADEDCEGPTEVVIQTNHVKKLLVHQSARF